MGGGMAGAAGAIAAMGATAAAAIGVKGVQAASAFGLQMAEVATLTNLSVAEQEKLEKGVRSLSVQFGAASEELTGGLYQALSAGVPKDNAIDFLSVASMAAQAGVTDVKTAVDGISSVINAFGMDASQAEEVADSLFTTVRGGKTTFAELAANIGKVAPLASAAGVSMDQMNALLVQMTKRGLSTEEATTALKGTLTALIKPAGKLASQLGKVKKVGLVKTLEDMVEASGGAVENVVKLFPNVQGLLGVLSAGLNGGGINQTLDEFTNKAGAAAEASAKIAATLSAQFDIMKARTDDALLGVGQALVPEVEKLLTELTELFKNPEFDKALASFGSNLSILLAGVIPTVEALAWAMGQLAEAGKAVEEFVNPTPTDEKITMGGKRTGWQGRRMRRKEDEQQRWRSQQFGTTASGLRVDLSAPKRGPGGRGLQRGGLFEMTTRNYRDLVARIESIDDNINGRLPPNLEGG